MKMNARDCWCLFCLILFSFSQGRRRSRREHSIWRSANIVKVICNQWKSHNETGSGPLPEPVKFKKRGNVCCGWFRKGTAAAESSSAGKIAFGSCDLEHSVSPDRIVGGHDAPPHKYKSILGLFYNNNFECGASIYNEEWAITAAHCLKKSKEPARYLLVAGMHNLDYNDGFEQEVYVVKIVVHKYFDSRRFFNDIAVLKVSPKFQFNDKVSPPKWPQSSYEPKGTGMAVGWGSTRSGGNIVAILQEVEISIISNQQCQEWYKDIYTITDEMLCAGEAEGKKDSCQGDSGGPFYIITEGGDFTQVGIVSFGQGCAVAKKPGIYTKVSKYLDWIRQNAQG